jgi:type II secretory pathway pseudopilin PulG
MKNFRGFLLIEILVSLVVLTAGVLFLVRSLSGILRSNRHVNNNQQAFLLIDNLLNRLYAGEKTGYLEEMVRDNPEFLCSLETTEMDEHLLNITLSVRWRPKENSSGVFFSHVVINP